MAKLKLFALSFLLTTVGVLAAIYLTRPRAAATNLVSLGGTVFLSSQLEPQDVRSIRRRHIKTIVDFRPDGEAKDQASAAEIEQQTKKFGMEFHYIPVPHESIPDRAVEKLEEVLSHGAGPTVFYCRTGRRAVRTFALAEASQTNGPMIETIMAMVQAAGFSAEDLRGKIAERIAGRNNHSGGKN